MLVVVNKWDLVDQKAWSEEAMAADVQGQLRHVNWAGVVCTTATEGTRELWVSVACTGSAWLGVCTDFCSIAFRPGD